MEIKYGAVDVENILDIIDSDGLESLMKILHKQVANLEKDVLVFDLKESSFANLAIAKARLDGGKLLLSKLEQELISIKRKSHEQSQRSE